MHSKTIMNLLTQGSFTISDGINGSSLYYTVSYFNATSGQNNNNNMICGSDSISSSSCQQGVCTSSLPLSCYQNSGAVNVSISATNTLGNGLASSVSIGMLHSCCILWITSALSFHLGTKNEYVDVKFESATRIVCEFRNQVRRNNKLCTIIYGECQKPLIMTIRGNTTNDSPNTVRLELHSYLQNYCYIINATNGTYTVLIEGIYSEWSTVT